jgi:helicase SWR1
MDKQCEDRAHRIGQMRDVHIYRFVSQHTVEEAMLQKANQKRSLDDIVIQKGEFDWRAIFRDESEGGEIGNGAVAALTQALGEFEDVEDARAADLAAREEYAIMGADNADFGAEGGGDTRSRSRTAPASEVVHTEEALDEQREEEVGEAEFEDEQDEEEGGTVTDYMVTFVQHDWDFFKDWRS